MANSFVANVLDPEGARALADHAQIEQVLRGRKYKLVFQPIFNLCSGRVSAVEALARFGGPRSTPDVWFAQAHRVGLGVELEVALVEAAVAELGRLPENSLMAVNAGPEALASGAITDALQGVDASRVVVELTEHAAVKDYPHLLECLRSCAGGARLAIDDAGAGFASLMHILKLAPDFIKLDRELISGSISIPSGAPWRSR